MSTSDEDRWQQLEARLAQMEARLLELEAQRRRPSPTGLDLPLLERLRSRPEFDQGTVQGGILYAGAAEIGGRSHVWQVERAASELLASPREALAPVFAALGHPLRLQVVLALLERPRTAPELTELAGASSPGQLYHHLDKLLAAGVISQMERGGYVVTGKGVVPLLAMLAAAGDLGGE
jgi:DNA-binding transcriptional ArsR family regulator